MDLSKLETALESQVKRATEPEIKKAKRAGQKKLKEMRKSMASKKEDSKDAFGDLADIVNLRKQKAVANELEEFIHEQEERKKERDHKPKKEQKKEQTESQPTLLQMLLAKNPDKISELSMDDVMKMSMLMGGGGGNGGVDPLGMMMMMGMNQNNNGNDMNNELMKLMFKKLFDEDKKGDSGMSKILEWMMIQNMQQQQMFMNMLKNNGDSNKKKDESNPLLKEMLSLIKGQSNIKEQMLMDKLKELEYRTQSSDPLGEAKRMMDYMKSFKSFFGSQNQSPEMLEHERKMKEMEFDQNRQLKEEEIQGQRMAQIGDMINKGIGTFADVLSKPAADAIKTKLDEVSKKGFNPNNIPERNLHNEVDLGDLEVGDSMDLDMPEAPAEAPAFNKSGKMPRFRVSEKGDDY